MYKRGRILNCNLAFSQIFILVFAVFSFAFLISDIGLVEAQTVSQRGSFDARGNFVARDSGEIIKKAFRGQITYSDSEGNLISDLGSSNPEIIGPLTKEQIGNINRPVEIPKPGDSDYIVPLSKEQLDKTSAGAVGGIKGVTKNFAITGAKVTGKYEGVSSFKQFADGTGEIGGVKVSATELAEFKGQIASAGGSVDEIVPHKGPLGFTGGFGHLATGVSWAIAAVGAIQLIGGLAGWDDSLTNALSYGAAAGIMTTSALQSFGPTGFTGVSGLSYGPGNFLGTSYGPLTGAGWIGLGVAVAVFVLTYKKESQKIYNFQCLPFEAPVKGEDCEKCNDDSFRPCSEYRCRSLGQACELTNQGSSEEKCVWVNPNDAVSPTITPWSEVLTENHRYTNRDVRPDSRGTKIIYENSADGCLQAFTPLRFGVTTNEPAQCKIDFEHKETYDEMQFFFGNTNFYLYNHTQQFSLPSPDSLNAELPELENDGNYDFFVRCRDKNGNENLDEFAIQLCVDPSPDTTAPVIVATSIPSESYVQFGAENVPLEVYVNEPSECKWSTQSKEYSVMENTMSCATSLTQINARELYTCSTELTGISDREENNFYFRCKDQPSKAEEDRYVNVVSYEFILFGSQPLNIISSGPNETTIGNTQTVPVELKLITDDGAQEGTAICSFSDTGEEGNYVLMFETNSFEHKQILNLPTGNYNYFFRCVDIGGNAVEAEVSFGVIVDTQAPLVTRIYHDQPNSALKAVTNEDATCVYSLNSCNYVFEEGLEMVYSNPSVRTSHFAEWQSNQVYYIKCKDNFGNEPGPNSCSIIASTV
jgi:hypothetical protein